MELTKYVGCQIRNAQSRRLISWKVKQLSLINFYTQLHSYNIIAGTINTIIAKQQPKFFIYIYHEYDVSAVRYLISIKKTATSINTVDGDFVKILKLKKSFFLIIFLCIFVFFASAAPQRPTCSYHANPAGSPTRNDMSLQVGEMQDSNPGLQVLQSGALLSLSFQS